MKTKKILLSLLCVGAVLGTVSCKDKTETPTPTDPETQITEPTTAPETGGNQKTEETGSVETQTSYKATLVYNNGAENGSIDSVEDGGKYYFDKPTDPTQQYKKFAGWYTDEALTQPFNFNSEVSANITLYAKWVAAYDTVNTIWDFKAAAASINAEATGNIVVPGDGAVTYQSKFTVEANGKSRFEIGSKDAFNTQGTSIIVHLTAEGNTNGLTVTYKWASSDAGNVVIRNVATGEVVHTAAKENGSAEETVTKSNLPAGDYEIVGIISETKNSSLRIYGLSITEQLPQGPTSGISVSHTGAELNFLKGRQFDASGIVVTLDYENGRQDTLAADKYTVSAVDMTTAGKKTVTISYQLNATTTYTDTYEVVVWEAASLNVYTYTYNGVTNHARYVYFSNETEKSVANITVKALCTAPQVEGTYEFKLAANEYAVDTTNTNKIEFTYGDLDAEFNYITMDSVDLSADEAVAITVYPNAAVGYDNGTGIYNVHTIMQAMQLLEMAKVSDDAVKYVVLADGVTYKEKVEITLPNVTLVSDFVMNGDSEGTPATIEYGLLAGDTEPGESRIYVTDGSASVSIRKSAEGFVAYFVNFVNSYNTYDEYQVAKTMTNDTQGVAVLVQADKSTFAYCSFSGYQDTLYAQVGRQYYQNCYIEGHTDFIFGYDATAYFNECEIMSIGAGVDQNNGGYIVATKGNTTQAIEFGYVFDECEFTADENTMAGSISLARGWDTNMTMAIINSTISGHYSKEAYGYVTPDNPDTEAVEKNLNDRYGKMNAAPVASQLVEYNNTGAGAITESLADTCTVLTAEQAEKYVPANIFTANNGGTKYTSSWNPLATETATLTILNTDDSEFLTVEEFGLVGSAATRAEYEGLISSENTPAGKAFGGFYADKECTTPYDPNKVLEATNVIYVKWNDAAVFTATTINFDSLSGKIESNLVLNNGLVTLVATSEKSFTVDASGKSYIDVNGQQQTSVMRLKTGGKTDKGARCIIIDLSDYSGKFVIGVNAVTGRSGESRTGQVREGAIDGTSLGVVNCPAGSDVTLSEVTVEGGKIYYITADASINFYSINIAPKTE